jgi:type I restriction enzyme R subunit
VPDILKVPPISNHGNVLEIADKFGGAEHLRAAIESLQNLLYTEAA